MIFAIINLDRSKFSFLQLFCDKRLLCLPYHKLELFLIQKCKQNSNCDNMRKTNGRKQILPCVFYNACTKTDKVRSSLRQRAENEHLIAIYYLSTKYFSVVCVCVCVCVFV